MLKITKRRERVEVTYYQLSYRWRSDPHAGFSFDCDSDGRVDEATMNPVALDNLRKCRDGKLDVVGPEVQTLHHSYVEPAEGTCPCGRSVVLSGDTRGEGIDCECGRVYNGSGQELAPRSQWDDNDGSPWSGAIDADERW